MAVEGDFAGFTGIGRLVHAGPFPGSAASSLTAGVSIAAPSFNTKASFVAFVTSVVDGIYPFLALSPARVGTNLSKTRTGWTAPADKLSAVSPSTISTAKTTAILSSFLRVTNATSTSASTAIRARLTTKAKAI